MLVRQAIEDRVAARDIPDLDMRRHMPTLEPRQEIPRTRMKVGPDAVPQVTGYTFLLRTTAELQAEADRTHTSTTFIIVNSTEIAGTMAVVNLGTDILLPTDSETFRLCCCWGDGHFNGVDSRWVFERWSSMVCS